MAALDEHRRTVLGALCGEHGYFPGVAASVSA
jgi:hypothetical protein